MPSSVSGPVPRNGATCFPPGSEPLTIPNFITIGRFVLVPIVVYALLSGQVGWALFGFLVAGISDGVDGIVARQLNQRSELGAYLDPIADKFLLVSVFIVLGYLGEIPLWLVLLVVSRDALIIMAVILGAVMGHPIKVRPLMVSKANTVAQIALASVVLAELAFQTMFGAVRVALILLTGLLTTASTIAYFVTWLRHIGEPPATGEDSD